MDRFFLLSAYGLGYATFIHPLAWLLYSHWRLKLGLIGNAQVFIFTWACSMFLAFVIELFGESRFPFSSGSSDVHLRPLFIATISSWAAHAAVSESRDQELRCDPEEASRYRKTRQISVAVALAVTVVPVALLWGRELLSGPSSITQCVDEYVAPQKGETAAMILSIACNKLFNEDRASAADSEYIKCIFDRVPGIETKSGAIAARLACEAEHPK